MRGETGSGVHESGCGRYCCKSPKLKSDNFPARRQSKSRSLIDVASISLPKSPVSLSLGDEVPHMFTRKARLRLGEISISSAKRLLQQNRHEADLNRCPLFCRCWCISGHRSTRSVWADLLSTRAKCHRMYCMLGRFIWNGLAALGGRARDSRAKAKSSRETSIRRQPADPMTRPGSRWGGRLAGWGLQRSNNQLDFHSTTSMRKSSGTSSSFAILANGIFVRTCG